MVDNTAYGSPFAAVADAHVDFKNRYHPSERERSGSGNALARSPTLCDG